MAQHDSKKHRNDQPHPLGTVQGEHTSVGLTPDHAEHALLYEYMQHSTQTTLAHASPPKHPAASASTMRATAALHGCPSPPDRAIPHPTGCIRRSDVALLPTFRGRCRGRETVFQRVVVEGHRVSFDDLSKFRLDGRVHVQLVVLDAVWEDKVLSDAKGRRNRGRGNAPEPSDGGPLESLTKLFDALFGVVAAAVMADTAELVAVQTALESRQTDQWACWQTQPLFCGDARARRTSAQLWRSTRL